MIQVWYHDKEIAGKCRTLLDSMPNCVCGVGVMGGGGGGAHQILISIM